MFSYGISCLIELVRSRNVSIVSVACSSMAAIFWNFDFLRTLNDSEATELASLLVLLDGVFLSYSPDIRVWNLISSWVFSCKSFFDKLIDNLSVPLFPIHKRIWKVVAPHKLKFCVWSLAQRGVKKEGLITLFALNGV
ncbi:hypothetical protein CsSME_00036071 [Camellia sinensis var. sinensis]